MSIGWNFVLKVVKTLRGLRWLALILLLIGTSSAAETWRVHDFGDLNAREGPGTEFPIVTTLRSGTAVKELERNGSWSLVQIADGTEVYVHNSYLVPNSDTPRSGQLTYADAGLDRWKPHFQTGHSRPVFSVSFHPDGRIIATGSWDSTARLWDMESGREIRVLHGHTATVTSISFSPDGRTLATGAGDTTVRLWDVESGRELRVLHGHTASVISLSFSPDGRTLATGSSGGSNAEGWDGSIRLWDVASGRQLHLLKPYGNSVQSVAFSLDGSTLMTFVEFFDSVTLWDVVSGQELHSTRGSDLSINLWSDLLIDGVAFGPDARAFFAGGRYTDVGSGQELWVPDRDLSEHKIIFSPDGHTFATFQPDPWDGDSTVRLWDMEIRQETQVLEGGLSTKIQSVSFSPDKLTLATGSDDGTARLWDVRTGQELRVLKDFSRQVTSVSLSPDGVTLAAGSDDGTARLWDVRTGQELHVFEDFSGRVVGVSFSPDGSTFAIGSDDGNDGSSIHLWDVGTGRKLRSEEFDWNDNGNLHGLSFSPDGRTIAAAFGYVKYNISSLHFWDVETGRILPRQLSYDEWESDSFYGVSFSPDGRTVAAGSWPELVFLWDMNSGQNMTLRGHSGAVISVSFHPNGRILASGSKDGTARLWDVQTGRELFVLDGHINSVNSVSFSSDGGTLATGSDDGSIRLWDTETGRERALITYFDDGSRIVMTPEGFFDATGDAAKHIYLVKGVETISIDQVYDALYRPDLVKEALAGDPTGKVAAATAQLDLEAILMSGLPPTAVGLRSLDGNTVDGGSANLQVEFETRSGGLGRIEWRVNGAVKGFDLDSRGLDRVNANTTRHDKRVFLEPGENLISVVAYNEAGLIASEPVEITVTNLQTTLPKPSLHVLAVGVDDYLDSRLQLNYVVSDARAIGTALIKAGRELYNTVSVTYLLDKQVSVEGLSAVFDEMSARVRPHDTFVFFFGGSWQDI